MEWLKFECELSFFATWYAAALSLFFPDEQIFESEYIAFISVRWTIIFFLSLALFPTTKKSGWVSLELVWRPFYALCVSMVKSFRHFLLPLSFFFDLFGPTLSCRKMVKRFLFLATCIILPQLLYFGMALVVGALLSPMLLYFASF